MVEDSHGVEWCSQVPLFPYVSLYSYYPPCSVPHQEPRSPCFSPWCSLSRRISCVSLQLIHGFLVLLEWCMGGSLFLSAQRGTTRTSPSPLPQHRLMPLHLVCQELCFSSVAGSSHLHLRNPLTGWLQWTCFQLSGNSRREVFVYLFVQIVSALWGPQITWVVSSDQGDDFCLHVFLCFDS